VIPPSSFAAQLRQELTLRSRIYARGRAHVESYGSAPVIVFEPEYGLHGNFFDPAYTAIAANPDWMRRFDKVHAQAARSLPKPQLDPSPALARARLLHELRRPADEHVFCTPGVADSPAVRDALGVDAEAAPIFGWKARVPLANGRFDRTEVDMRFGSLLVEAKLTEAGFQRAPPPSSKLIAISTLSSTAIASRVSRSPHRAGCGPANFLRTIRRNSKASLPIPHSSFWSPSIDTIFRPPGEPGYAGYQLIRSVLAAFAAECSFCVIHDERRPDLREQWFEVMAAVKSAALRVR
jgi:hypothetical protein